MSVQGDVVVANSLEGVGPFYALFGGVGWVDTDALAYAAKLVGVGCVPVRSHLWMESEGSMI